MTNDNYPPGTDMSYFDGDPKDDEIIGKDFLGQTIYGDDKYIEFYHWLVLEDDLMDFADFLIRMDPGLVKEIVAEYVGGKE